MAARSCALAFLVTRQYLPTEAYALVLPAGSVWFQREAQANPEYASVYVPVNIESRVIRLRFSSAVSLPLLPACALVHIGPAVWSSATEVTLDSSRLWFGVWSFSFPRKPPIQKDWIACCIAASYPIQPDGTTPIYDPINYVYTALALPTWSRLQAHWRMRDAVDLYDEVVSVRNAHAHTAHDALCALVPMGVPLRWHGPSTATAVNISYEYKEERPRDHKHVIVTVRNMGYTEAGQREELSELLRELQESQTASSQVTANGAKKKRKRLPRDYHPTFGYRFAPALRAALTRNIVSADATLMEVLWVKRVLFYYYWALWLGLPVFHTTHLYRWQVFRLFSLDLIQAECLLHMALQQHAPPVTVELLLSERKVKDGVIASALRQNPDDTEEDIAKALGISPELTWSDARQLMHRLDGVMPPMVCNTSTLFHRTDHDTISLVKQARYGDTPVSGLRGCQLMGEEKTCTLGMWCEWHLLWQEERQPVSTVLPRDPFLMGVLCGMINGGTGLVSRDTDRGLAAARVMVQQRLRHFHTQQMTTRHQNNMLKHNVAITMLLCQQLVEERFSGARQLESQIAVMYRSAPTEQELLCIPKML